MHGGGTFGLPQKFPPSLSNHLFLCQAPVRTTSSGGPKEDHLKVGHLKMGFRSEFSLKKSIFGALSKAIPQGKCRLDRGSAV